MISSGDPRSGLLLALRSLLWVMGVPREQIVEDLTEYKRLPIADLEVVIGRLHEVLRPARPDEGSSRRPHAGDTGSGAHRYV